MGRHAAQRVWLGLGLLVVGSLLAVGTVHPPWILLFSASALTLGAYCLAQVGGDIRRVPPPAWILVGLAAFTTLQAVPLPLDWVCWLSPHTGDVWQRSVTPLGLPPPAWASLSIDPGATLTEALKWLAYAAVFSVAALLARRQGTSPGALLVFAAAVAAALLTLGHAATAAERLYGVYTPVAARPPWALAPLLNPNNLAGYLNLGFFTGLGLLAATRRPAARAVLALASSCLVAVSILSGSRGGLLALACGALLLLAFGGLLLLRHREPFCVKRAWAVLPAAATLLLGGVFVFFGLTPRVRAELTVETTGKLLLLDWTRPLLRDHPWWGTGRGTYETAFPPYRAGTGHLVFNSPENFLVQWAAEWGLPVTLAALIGFAVAFRPRSLALGRRPVATAAGVGLLVLCVQNTVDLGLEITSIGFAVATTLGSLWGSAHRHDHRWLPPGVPRLRSLPLGVFTSWSVLLLVATAWLGLEPVAAARQRLHQQFLSVAPGDAAAAAAFVDDLARGLRAHPGDPYLPLLGALHADRTGGHPLPWLNRALERDPRGSRPYLVLAQVLANRGARRQATAAALLAIERGQELIPLAAPLLVQLAGDARTLIAIAPDGERGAALLTHGADRWPREAPASERLALLEAAVARAPAAVPSRRALAHATLALLRQRPPSPWCEPEGAPCRASVEVQATALEELLPRRPDGPLLRAELLLATGHPCQSAEFLAERCVTWPRHVECRRLHASAADQCGDSEQLSIARDALLAAACSKPEPCVRSARWLASLYARRQAWAEESRLLERVARETGDPEDWQLVAAAALRDGSLTRAERAVERARQGGSPTNAELSRQLDEARRQRLWLGSDEAKR